MGLAAPKSLLDQKAADVEAAINPAVEGGMPVSPPLCSCSYNCVAVKQYEDPFSASAFGSATVTVTTTVGFAPEEDTLLQDPPVKKRRRPHDDETAFERIQRKSKGQMLPKRRKKSKEPGRKEVMAELARKKKGKGKKKGGGYGASRKKGARK